MIRLRRLRPDDDRTRFSCGQPDLDRFFLRYAGHNQFKHHVGVTWVAVDDDDGDNRIVGFATVNASHIEASDLPPDQRNRLARYPLPILRLARLGVDQSAQGRGVGLKLLKGVLMLARQMAAEVGCIGVVVDAKSEAIPFYERFGFEVLDDVIEGELGDRPATAPMFLPLRLIPAVEP